MTIALWCVFLAGVLPYVATLIAKGGHPGFDNRDPRGWLAQQEGFRQRANAAQLNTFEAFPFFAVAVLTAHLLNGPQGLVDLLAVVFIAARMLFLACYLANRATLRSFTWFVAHGCAVAIFIVAA
ncbi:MAG TPA: MAPEG family protein [Steroidobacteraceae bacterium]|nr:MAPEG family protein [Steroidobacteraceae bacterium]